MTAPTEIYAGVNATWSITLTDFPASQWTLKYALFNSMAVYTIQAAANATAHQIDLAPNDTANWEPGRYDWTAYVENADGARHVVGDGRITIKVNPTAITTGYDGRSHARKMLDAIEAALEGKANSKQLDMVRGEFGGRSIEREPQKLVALRDKYRAEVAAEERAAAIAAGQAVSGKLKVRF